jgi:hypothetical protein
LLPNYTKIQQTFSTPQGQKLNVLRVGQPAEMELLAHSRLLRGMARSIRRVCLSAVLFSTAYILVFIFADSRFGVAPTVLFGVFQLAQALVPYVAMYALDRMGRRREKNTFKRTIKNNRIEPSYVESSDCGTLS